MSLHDGNMPRQTVDKLTPDDKRVEHRFATLNGVKYHYLYASPAKPVATIFLIHGWPDFSFGWRCQIPFLLNQGFRIVAPDMIGYGQTEAPQDLRFYTNKRAATDLKELARQLEIPRFILLGHDWGGAIVYRVALWYPEIIQAVISICTPYSRPHMELVTTEDMVKGNLPQFEYQLVLASGDVEKEIQTKEEIKQFLNALYGARAKDGELGFDVNKGPLFDVIKSGRLQRSNLFSEEELEYYAQNYANTGMRGTVNWYRTRQLNWEEELPLAKQGNDLKIKPPTMFVFATRDAALPDFMNRGAEKNFVEYRKEQVEGTHWCMTQFPNDVNKVLGAYLKEIVSRQGKGPHAGEGKLFAHESVRVKC
jgi:pimeloyl-ACP methyl ester carboxylesterase